MDMNIWGGLVLGIVQGVTEFLPVSSDGHLLLFRSIAGWKDQGLLFDASLHLGTFFAVLFLYRDTWKRMALSVVRGGGRDEHRLLWALAIATIPGVIVGLIFDKMLEESLRSIFMAGVGFLVTAALLFFVRKDGAGEKEPERLGVKQLLFIGILQAFAVLPGVSRSAATIFGGLKSKLGKEKAVEFSFLLAMPITGGAGLVALIGGIGAGDFSPASVAIGTLAAAVSGYFAMRFLLGLVRKWNVAVFVPYLLAASAVSFLLAFI